MKHGLRERGECSARARGFFICYNMHEVEWDCMKEVSKLTDVKQGVD